MSARIDSTIACDRGAGLGVIGRLGHRAVLDLDALQRDRGILQPQPCGGVLDADRAAVLDDLGFADDGLAGVRGLGH